MRKCLKVLLSTRKSRLLFQKFTRAEVEVFCMSLVEQNRTKIRLLVVAEVQ